MDPDIQGKLLKTVGWLHDPENVCVLSALWQSWPAAEGLSYYWREKSWHRYLESNRISRGLWNYHWELYFSVWQTKSFFICGWFGYKESFLLNSKNVIHFEDRPTFTLGKSLNWLTEAVTFVQYVSVISSKIKSGFNMVNHPPKFLKSFT